MQIKSTFSSFSVKSLDQVKAFYSETLGLNTKEETEMGSLNITLPGGGSIFIYPKDNHEPATFTVLNLVVDNVDAAVDELTAKGVKFEIYEGFGQNEKGIAQSPDLAKGPSIAWFKDPAGNILSVIEG